MITNLENLKAIFNDMAKNDWDTSKEMKWGYFFIDIYDDNLKEVYEYLKESHYILESLEDIDKQEHIWRLNLSKIEVHTPESLNNRNEAMNRLAEHYCVESYDGWDVERIK